MRGFRIVSAKTLSEARKALAANERHVQQNAALVTEKARLLVELAQVQRGHGAECRNRYVSDLEARLRRLHAQLDGAMGYDKSTEYALDRGATVARAVAS